MKLKFFPILILAIALWILPAMSASALQFPISGGVLQTPMNANGKAITNVQKVVFSDGTTQDTSGATNVNNATGTNVNLSGTFTGDSFSDATGPLPAAVNIITNNAVIDATPVWKFTFPPDLIASANLFGCDFYQTNDPGGFQASTVDIYGTTTNGLFYYALSLVTNSTTVTLEEGTVQMQNGVISLPSNIFTNIPFDGRWNLSGFYNPVNNRTLYDPGTIGIGNWLIAESQTNFQAKLPDGQHMLFGYKIPASSLFGQAQFDGTAFSPGILNSYYAEPPSTDGYNYGLGFLIRDAGSSWGVASFKIYSEDAGGVGAGPVVSLGTTFVQHINCKLDFDFNMNSGAPFWVGLNNGAGNIFMRWMDGNFYMTNGITGASSKIDTNGNFSTSGTISGTFTGAITNNGIVWFSLKTNGIPNITAPSGSICTTTNGQFFVRSNTVWVLK